MKFIVLIEKLPKLLNPHHILKHHLHQQPILLTLILHLLYNLLTHIPNYQRKPLHIQRKHSIPLLFGVSVVESVDGGGRDFDL